MTQQQTRPLEVTDKRGFINPYNFVSTPARTGPALNAELGCHAPVGHRRYGEDLLSGRLRILLTAKTPLLLCDAEKRPRQGTSPGGTYLAVKTGPDGKSPLLNGSALKGMLRSAYETITNSRLGVFAGHDEPLAVRATMRGESDLFVGLVIPGDDQESLQIRVCKPVYIGMDMLKRARRENPAGIYAKVRKRLGDEPGWDAVEILTAKSAEEISCSAGESVISGMVFETGKTFHTATTEKKHERLVVLREWQNNRWTKNGQIFECNIPVDQHLAQAWDAIIDSYAEAHKDGRHPARPGTVLGSYITKPHEWRGLKRGRSMFVRISRADPTEVLLTPSAIGRIPYSDAPAELLPASHHPAVSLSELSPADRVFGWTRTESGGDPVAAYRGQLRIDSAWGGHDGSEKPVRKFERPFQLATLNGPKPGQARFYTGDSQQNSLADGTPVTPATAFKKDTKQLRGRKIYLTQPELLKDEANAYFTPAGAPTTPVGSGMNARYREYLKVKNPREGSNEKMDVFVTSWVNTGTVFTTDLHFTNLNRLELGALVWLLELPAGAMLHIGRGKPYGFGAVQLAYEPSASEVYDYPALVSRYGGAPAKPDMSFADVQKEFAKTQDENQSLGRIRDEFLAASFGVLGVPTHYPRPGLENGQKPGPSSEPYKWWAQNSDPQRAGKSLPPLTAEKAPVLPYTIPTRQVVNVNPRQGNWHPRRNNGAGQGGNGYRPGHR